jgi:hypothetical protein
MPEHEQPTNVQSAISVYRRRISPQQAREQAAEATGFTASIDIVIGDEVFEVPQRGLLDDDQRERMDELDIETETWDHEDDIVVPARTIKKPDGTEEVIEPMRTMKGGLKIPYRKGGVLIKPPYPVQVAIALWGELRYQKYKSLGGRAADVTSTMARLDRRLERREQGDEEEGKPADPKSEGGTG